MIVGIAILNCIDCIVNTKYGVCVVYGCIVLGCINDLKYDLKFDIFFTPTKSDIMRNAEYKLYV